MVYYTSSPEETEELGRKVARVIKETDGFFFVAMYGDLGAGKTVFVRGFASVLSPSSRVKSPTYTIVNEYRKGEKPLFHFDLYRISSPDELDGFGFDDYLASGNCIAEWCENIGDRLPEGAVRVTVEKNGECGRKITVDGLDLSGETE